jgi:hypothetical protein
MRRIHKTDFITYINTIFNQNNLEIKGIPKNDVIKLVYQKTRGYNANLHYLLSISDEEKPKTLFSLLNSQKIRNLSTHHIVDIIVVILYIFLNTYEFIVTYHENAEIGGYGLGLARAGAMIIRINMLLIFIPLLLIKWVPVWYHVICGIMIYIMTIIHIIGHMIFGKSVYKDGAAITGWIMTLILLVNIPFLIWRRKYYNFFFYFHLVLLFVFVPLVCIHAVFTQYFGFPTAWLFIIGPYLLYFYVRYKRFNPVKALVLKSEILGPNESLIKLYLEPVFYYSRGQYIKLNIPQISKLESHPFSITTIPSDQSIGVIIQRSGDWTEKLYKDVGSLTYVNVDGPINSKLENLIKYKKIIIIASGIGITPYMTTLRGDLRSVEIHFIYVCREQCYFDLIPPYTPEVNYNIYYTGLSQSNVLYGNHIKNITDLIYDDMGVDIISGLPVKTHFGRPDLVSLLSDINSKNLCRTGVFFTGSHGLSKTIKNILKSRQFINFYFHEDSF